MSDRAFVEMTPLRASGSARLLYLALKAARRLEARDDPESRSLGNQLNAASSRFAAVFPPAAALVVASTLDEISPNDDDETYALETLSSLLDPSGERK